VSYRDRFFVIGAGLSKGSETQGRGRIFVRESLLVVFELRKCTLSYARSLGFTIFGLEQKGLRSTAVG